LGEIDGCTLRREILDEIFAYGPLTPLLEDPSVSEIMVNGRESIYLEREGRVTRHEGAFLSEESLRATIDRIVSRVNRRLDESSPYVDARLPDGSRVNAIIPKNSSASAPCPSRRPGISGRRFSNAVTSSFPAGRALGRPRC
jgi:pilus assembly protein CpaF